LLVLQSTLARCFSFGYIHNMNKVSIILALLLITGCKEVSFKNPQPEGKKALASVPKNLQGKYLVITDDGQPAKDTVIITSGGYHFGYYDLAERAAKQNDKYDVGILGDSLVLKSYKGYYFFNLNEKPEWLLRVLKQERNGDLWYMALEQKNVDFNDYLRKLSLEIPIDSMTTETETLYQIDPTPNELITLINKGYFSKSRLIKIK
jgi:hypothetical protein